MKCCGLVVVVLEIMTGAARCFCRVGSRERLDPATTLGGPDGALGHIFSGLTTLDTNLQVQPELAAGWTVSDDGLVYTFYLRKDVVFHNGRLFTAKDVIYSWERAADPETGSDTAQTYLGDIEGVVEKVKRPFRPNQRIACH